jgi:hypothetical protein
LEKSFKMKLKIFIWKKYENNNNGLKKKKSWQHHCWNVLYCKIQITFQSNSIKFFSLKC